MVDLQPAFIRSATYFRNPAEIEKGRALPFGVTEATLDKLIESTAVASYRSDAVATDVPHLASALRDIADETLRRYEIERPSRLLRQWLCEEAICAWTVSHIDYDEALAGEKDFERWWSGIRPEVTLGKSPMRTICSGNAFLTRDLARALTKETGIEARYVGGWLRSDDGSVPQASNHAWTCFVFEGGLEVPADTVSPLVTRERRRDWKVKNGAWEVFLAFHNGVTTFSDNVWKPMPKAPQDPFRRLSFPKWVQSRDVSTALVLRRTGRYID